jgi:hypothetical protein
MKVLPSSQERANKMISNHPIIMIHVASGKSLSLSFGKGRLMEILTERV